jgi:lactaldehyde reductase
MEWNGEVCPDRFRDMAREFELDVEYLSDKETVQKVCEAVRGLALRLNIPQHIKDVGGKEADIEMLSDKAMNDPCKPGNPREVTKEDFMMLFKKCF